VAAIYLKGAGFMALASSGNAGRRCWQAALKV
jgi:hypothetical protein